MFVFYFLFTLSSILALDPAHLKPGALTAHLGRVALVEDVLWVRYPYAALVTIPGKLREVTEQLNAALTQLEQDLQKRRADRSFDFLPLLHARVTYLNDTINLALENYSGLDTANRTKRGLIDGIGQLSRLLFGTAMNEDVEKLRDRYNQLTSIASANNKAIHLTCRKIA
ncbi:MAG: hypothetical protein DSY32_02030, partial [Aquifex sp.]